MRPVLPAAAAEQQQTSTLQQPDRFTLPYTSYVQSEKGEEQGEGRDRDTGAEGADGNLVSDPVQKHGRGALLLMKLQAILASMTVKVDCWRNQPMPFHHVVCTSTEALKHS